MRVQNFYKSKSDFGELKGARQFLIPILSKFYQYDTEDTERLKENSLPLTTLMNCVETILDTLYNQDYPELSVNEIWDSLKHVSGKPDSESPQIRFFDLTYEYHVNRWYEATIIFGAAYFVMALERPEMKDCLNAIKNRASCCADSIPYFIIFEEEYESIHKRLLEHPEQYNLGKKGIRDSVLESRDEKILMNKASFLLNALRTQQPGAPPEVLIYIYENELRKEEQKESPNPYYLELLELQLRAERSKIDLESRKIPEGYVSVDAILDATESYFKDDAERILNALTYVVAQNNGTELERIEAKKKALMQFSSYHKSLDSKIGMTAGQQALFFYYLFNSLGLNFHNSDKAAWVRLIHSVTGKNPDNLRDRLNFRFEDLQTRKDLRYVAGCLKELFPSISSQIDRDSSSQ
ncbi:MAG: hypothetical protein IKM75_03200 [Bacteroidales bacterium]|jgi:hypothetical protein|nr:hypothetical protein [Bacteroidales bacterium]